MPSKVHFCEAPRRQCPAHPKQNIDKIIIANRSVSFKVRGGIDDFCANVIGQVQSQMRLRTVLTIATRTGSAQLIRPCHSTPCCSANYDSKAVRAAVQARLRHVLQGFVALLAQEMLFLAKNC